MKAFIDSLPDLSLTKAEDVRSVIRASMFHAAQLSPANTARLLRFLATNNINDGRLLQRYSEKVADSNFEGYTANDLALVLNSFTRLQFHSRDLFNAAITHLRSIPDTVIVPERALGLIYNAFARANVADAKLFDDLSTIMRRSLQTVSPHTAGNICHALGKLRIRTPTALDDVRQVTAHVLKNHSSRTTPQELSNMLYSLGNLGIHDTDLVEPLVHIIKRKARKLNSIEVAAICTSLAKLGINDGPLFRQIAQLVETHQSKYTLYECVAVMHAFSQLDVVVPEKIFSEIFPLILQKSSGQIDPKTACIAFNAYARLSIPPPDDIHQYLCTSILKETDSQYLINVVFSAGQMYSEQLPLDSSSSDFVSTLCSKIHSATPIINPINCTQLIFALNKLQQTAVPLYEQTILNSITIIPEFEVNQIANILYGLALRTTKTITESEHELINGLIASRKIFNSDSPQLVSSIVESAAILNIGDESVWKNLIDCVIAKCPDDPKIDVKTLAALSTREGQNTMETVNVILHRMDIQKLATNEIVKLLSVLGDSNFTIACNAVVEEVSRKIHALVCERIEKISNLGEVFGLINRLNNQQSQFPADLYRQTTRELNDSNFADLCCRLDEKISSLTTPEERVDYTLSALNDLRNVKSDALRQAVTDQLVGIVRDQQLDLSTIARTVKYLSPLYDKTLSRVVKRLLVESKEGSIPFDRHLLRVATTLLRIDSPELVDILMRDFLPKWLEDIMDRYPREIRTFVSKCPVRISPLVRDLALQVYQDGEKVDLHTYLMLADQDMDLSRLIPNTSLDYSLEEICEIAKMANNMEKQRVIWKHLARIGTNLSADLPVELLLEYVTQFEQLCRHENPRSQGEHRNVEKVINRILASQKIQVGWYGACLRLASAFEDLSAVTRILRSLMRSSIVPCGATRVEIGECIAVMRQEHRAWFRGEFTSSEQRYLESFM